MSCSQTRPGICSQTRPVISLCSLSGLSLQGRGQFLVLLNQSEQDQESLSALALDCLCQTGLTPWSVSLPFHRTILLFLLLCKIMFPGPVGALLRPFCKSVHQCPPVSCAALQLGRQKFLLYPSCWIATWGPLVSWTACPASMQSLVLQFQPLLQKCTLVSSSLLCCILQSPLLLVHQAGRAFSSTPPADMHLGVLQFHVVLYLCLCVSVCLGVPVYQTKY